ncbi:MAG: CBS domain-containing protein, partial [Methanolobus sp.]|nr:CBS domain-containing protein [Methanolobus sp.]
MDNEEKCPPGDSLKLSDRCKEITVDEIMSKDPISFREDDNVEKIIELAMQYPYHIYPVVDGKGNLAGTIDLDNILEFIFFERIPGND